MENDGTENFRNENQIWVIFVTVLRCRFSLEFGADIERPHHADEEQKLDIENHAKFGEIFHIPFVSELLNLMQDPITHLILHVALVTTTIMIVAVAMSCVLFRFHTDLVTIFHHAKSHLVFIQVESIKHETIEIALQLESVLFGGLSSYNLVDFTLFLVYFFKKLFSINGLAPLIHTGLYLLIEHF